MKEVEVESVPIDKELLALREKQVENAGKRITEERTKRDLMIQYGATGITENDISEEFSSPEVIEDLEKVVADLKKYGSAETYTFIPTESSKRIKKYSKYLKYLISKDKGKSVTNPDGRFVAIPEDYIQCDRCGAYKRPYNFYTSTGHGNKVRQVRICRECIRKMTDEFFEQYENVEHVLILMCLYTNCIYRKDVADIAIKNLKMNEQDPCMIYTYYRAELSTKQSGMLATDKDTFEYSNFSGNIFRFVTPEDNVPEAYFEDQNEGEQVEFSVRKGKQLVNKWGAGFTPEEYKKMEDLYNELSKFKSKKSNIIQQNALVEYVRLKIKLDGAIGKGDLKDIEKWQNMADKAAKNAGIKLDQLTAEDFGEGVDSWTSLVELVEEYDSVVPQMPKVKKMCYDDIDFIIWQVINYGRRLMELPEIEYEDIWKFIDEKFIAEMKRRGYTDKQIKKEREDRNAIFKELGDNYIEPLWLNPNLQEEEEEDLYED